MKQKHSLFQRKLLSWYTRHKRDLPWRRTRDPYKIWVSEVMLQQTQVNTVIPYYYRWLRRFPTIRSLAQASLDEVLKQWEGLGYYTRARNLHRAAKKIVRTRSARFPKTFDAIRSLPGIGRYTAGAIASIAFGLPYPVLDGNVSRVLVRLYAISKPPKLPRLTQELWKHAAQLLPKQSPGEFNQALMELGARICLPKKPMCLVCPVQAHCEARTLGMEEKLPAKSLSRKIPLLEVAVGVVKHKGRYFIQRRPPEGLLGGLWEFPGGRIEKGEKPEECLRRELKEEAGMKVKIVRRFPCVRHAYTHFRVILHPFECRLDGKKPGKGGGPKRWVRFEELSKYAFPAANRKIFEYLKKEK
ncbi:MAG: A/G-specific adenine glycosylase [Candidatus Omnitrophota bacterium]